MHYIKRIIFVPLKHTHSHRTPSSGTVPQETLHRKVGQMKSCRRKIGILTGLNRELKMRNKAQARTIVKSQTEIRGLLTENKRLQKHIKQLREDLRIAKLPANSSNSSRPPSTDLYPPTRNYSLRESSGKKTGGQPGHQGATMHFNEMADIVVEHQGEYCSVCGRSLQGTEQIHQEVRQVVDIAPPKPFITNHIVISRMCSCGHCNKTSFPPGVRSRLSYGKGVESLVANLSSRQYIPYGRLAEFINDFWGLSISEGTIGNILVRFADKAQKVYEHIHRQIPDAEVVGSDETGVKVNGKKGWYHVYQNPEWTFIGYHASRGSKAQEEFFPQGLPKSTLVSDCWASQLSTPARQHQACLSHILRELKAIGEAHPTQQWSGQLKALLQQALELAKTPHELHQVQDIEKKFARLLAKDQSQAPGKTPALWKRMNKHKDKIFTFLHNDKVPGDNNGSEQAIRNVKVKQKVSGQFKTEKGATQYALNRSIIDTLIKQGKNVNRGLKEIAGFETG